MRKKDFLTQRRSGAANDITCVASPRRCVKSSTFTCALLRVQETDGEQIEAEVVESKRVQTVDGIAADVAAEAD